MKRTIALLMTLVLVLGLAACGNTSSGTTAPASTEASQTAENEPSDSSAPANTASGKALVVYFSASGNTERVAKDIVEAAGADLFVIEPVKPYTSDDLNWTDDDSRVNDEHNNEALRDIQLKTTKVDGWDSYDTVFIGYPIWWGIAAWPVNNFVKNNDFSGKTVIPFATSTSSGMGESGELLRKMANTGDWQEGQRFSSGASEETVREWVSELKLK